MRVTAATLLVLAMCVVLTGCSTHRKDLEGQAPPQGLPALSTGEIATMAMSLLESEEGHLDLLSSEALAPLTSAATIMFERTGSPRALALGRQFADNLLEARITRSGVSGFFGAAGGPVPMAQITTISGLALIDAYVATHDPRYRDAAFAAANDVTNPALGWVSSPKGTGIRSGPGQGPNIAMTANAALLLERASRLGAPGLLTKSRAALRTAYSSQAAVGRWYANVGGHHPMSLAEWATTLFDLLADGSKESIGIAGGGVPALASEVFGRDGHLLQNDLTRGQSVGVAISLRMLAISPEESQANEAVGLVADLRRHNGTISLAPSDDGTTQAYFALAFAQMLARAPSSA